mgnify:CR=1 FL=1
MIEPFKFMVVVRASAGVLNSIIELCAQLRNDTNVVVCIVLHVPHTSDKEIVVKRI